MGSIWKTRCVGLELVILIFAFGVGGLLSDGWEVETGTCFDVDLGSLTDV